MNSLRITRAGGEVVSYLSALGRVRETRLTATVGYLAARFPAEFGPLLGFRPGSAAEIAVEETDEGDRYDVLIRNSGPALVIEGKLGMRQETTQLLRYIRRLRHQTGQRPALTVVDEGSALRHSFQEDFQGLRRQVSRLGFTTWTEVARTCRRIASRRSNARRDPVGTAIAGELATHLQENNMTHEARPEIYLRDVSTTDSVQLYFRHCIYKCQPSFLNSARGNLYFAPYFTQRTAEALREANLVPVGEGISFVSRVLSVQVIPTRDSLRYLKEQRHPHPAEAAKLIRSKHRMREVLIMRLGEPRLMFVSPITKAKLSRLDLEKRFTAGTMGSRICTFDDLLAASQG
jgi:hypothetical protein